MVLAGLTVLMTACSSDHGGTTTSQSAASATPSGLSEPLWNPCEQLSDDALRATKADPASKKVAIDSGQAVDAFTKVCEWRSVEGPYGVGVGSMRATQAQARSNTSWVGFRDVTIGPRQGLIYQDKTDAEGDKLSCYVNVPYAQGSIEVSVDWSYGERATAPQLPPCDLAVRHATELEPYFPK